MFRFGFGGVPSKRLRSGFRRRILTRLVQVVGQTADEIVAV